MSEPSNNDASTMSPLQAEIDRLRALVREMADHMTIAADVGISEGLLVDEEAEDERAYIARCAERAKKYLEGIEEVRTMNDTDRLSILVKSALINPSSLRLVAQLLGVPACPHCDYVMREKHACPDNAGDDERRRLDDYAQRLATMRKVWDDLPPDAAILLREIAADLAPVVRLRGREASAESPDERTAQKVTLLNALAALLEAR